MRKIGFRAQKTPVLHFEDTKTAHLGQKSRYSEIQFSQNPPFAPSLAATCVHPKALHQRIIRGATLGHGSLRDPGGRRHGGVLLRQQHQGPYLYDVRTGWGKRGSPKSRRKEQNQLISVHGQARRSGYDESRETHIQGCFISLGTVGNKNNSGARCQ